MIPALTAEGHEVESVKSLRLDGVDNGTLYELAAQQFDLCFTRDAAFVRRIRDLGQFARVKLLRVVIPQPAKKSLCLSLFPHFGRRTGRAMLTAMIGPGAMCDREISVGYLSRPVVFQVHESSAPFLPGV